MKPYHTIVLILSLAMATPVKAQDLELKRNNSFYLGVTDIYFNTIQLGFERKLGNHNTLVFQPGLKLSKKEDYYNRLGVNGEVQYRINLLYNKEAISKIARQYSTFPYFAPFIQYRYEEIRDKVTVGDVVNYQPSYVHSGFAGVLFGFRFTAMENRFCMNVYGGGGLKVSDTKGAKKYDDFLEVGYTGLTPKLGIQVGIVF
jgi:hypothetical protein